MKMRAEHRPPRSNQTERMSTASECKQAIMHRFFPVGYLDEGEQLAASG